MICPRCGYENEDDARFCRSCGAALPASGSATAGPAGPDGTPTAVTPIGGYPIQYAVEEHIGGRNRLTTFFRLILAIPHIILVGGPGLALSGGGGNVGNREIGAVVGLIFNGSGVIGLVVGVTSVISWFAIVITGKQPRGLWDFAAYYFRWRARAVAYMALLRDEYPPFGEGDYPAAISFGEFPERRRRLSVAFRIILVIPHVIVLFFVGIAWAITAIIGWFAILITGSYPQGLYGFATGYLRWSLRVEAYCVLMRDEYPPFSLE
jgi:hypothetical protein